MNSNENLSIQNDAEFENSMIAEYSESEMTRSIENVAEICTREIGSDVGLNRRPSKRNREINEEEIWTTVVRKSKRYGRSSKEDETTRIPEDKIEVSITCKEHLPKQFGLAKILRDENIKNVIKVKYINAFKALIQFCDEASAESILQSQKFKDIGITCQKTMEINQSYGVIKDIDLNLEEGEILQELSSETAILGVKRLKRKNTNDGHWEPSESIRVCFKGSSLPAYVYIYDTRVNVSPYTFPVTQCSRCWRFGHSIKFCPSLKIICPKCSKNHTNCETTLFKCNNCNGRHMAMSKMCPVFIKEKRIREIMAEFNCSYKRAITVYVPPSPRSNNISEDPPTLTPYVVSHQAPSLDEICPENNVPSSYANCVKEGEVKKRKKSKVKKQRKKKISKEVEEDISESLSDISNGDSVSRENVKDESKSKCTEQTSWKTLIKKLKDKIFEKENNLWEDKIKSCIGILFEGLLSFVMQFIADQPCYNFIKQLWTAACT